MSDLRKSSIQTLFRSLQDKIHEVLHVQQISKQKVKINLTEIHEILYKEEVLYEDQV